jgi:uncharacterized protein YjhX (UPF0386 family)
MVKALSGGGQNLSAVQRHLGYLSRGGELEIETDDGDRLHGKKAGRELVDRWDLDLDVCRRQSDLRAVNRRQPPKLAYKLIFSMPRGTPADKLAAAVRDFAREEFARKHRYAMVLHSDEPHPHVHMVVKAISEQGNRLHIQNATLREWRRQFARHLREQGVAANATERAVRGEHGTTTIDAIYRAARRGKSTYMRRRLSEIAAELSQGRLRIEPGKSTLESTRKEIERGWRAVSNILVRDGHIELAQKVARFVKTMPKLRTDKERLALQLLEHSRGGRSL